MNAENNKVNPKNYLLSKYAFKKVEGKNNLFEYKLCYGKHLVMRISKTGEIDVLFSDGLTEMSICLSFDCKRESDKRRIEDCINK